MGQSWGHGFYKCLHFAGRSQPRLLLKGAFLLPRGWTLFPPLSEHQGQRQPARRSLVPGGAGSGLQAEAFAPKVRARSGGGTLSGRQARLPGAAFPAGNDARGRGAGEALAVCGSPLSREPRASVVTHGALTLGATGHSPQRDDFVTQVGGSFRARAPKPHPRERQPGPCHPEPRRPLRGHGGATRRPSRVPAVSLRPVSGGVSLPAVARLLPAALRRPPSPPPRPPGLAEHEAPAESPLCDEERQLPGARWGQAGGVTADGVKSKAAGAARTPLCQPAWAPRQQLPAGPHHPRALC